MQKKLLGSPILLLSLLLLLGLNVRSAQAQCTFTSKPGTFGFDSPSAYTVTGTGCGTLPTGTSNIIISNGSTLLLNSNFTVTTGSITVQPGGALTETGGARTLTLGQSSGGSAGTLLTINRLGSSVGKVTVSRLEIIKATAVVNGALTTKCNLFIGNQAILNLGVGGLVDIQGNLELSPGNPAITGAGRVNVRGCVVGSNGALTALVQGTTLVCVRKLATTCGTGTCNNDVPVNNAANCAIITLPVELMAFDAKYRRGGVDVTWQTASERNSDHFVIERSTNGGEFVALNSVAAVGNSAKLVSYQWRDTRPLRGIGYYRLRQVDRDGTFSHSSVVSATTTPLTTEDAVVWPTEAKGLYNVRVAAEVAPGAQLTILTPLGRVVRTQPLETNGETQFDLRGQPAGLYLVRITTVHEQLTRRVLLTAE